MPFRPSVADVAVNSVLARPSESTHGSGGAGAAKDAGRAGGQILLRDCRAFIKRIFSGVAIEVATAAWEGVLWTTDLLTDQKRAVKRVSGGAGRLSAGCKLEKRSGTLLGGCCELGL